MGSMAGIFTVTNIENVRKILFSINRLELLIEDLSLADVATMKEIILVEKN